MEDAHTVSTTVAGITLTPASRELFEELVEDAGNWSGQPLFQGDQAQRGNLTHLKKLGLVETFEDRGGSFVSFTVRGKQVAGALGYDPQYLY